MAAYSVRREVRDRQRRAPRDEFGAVVASMTNRQRQVWARASYAGAHEREVEEIVMALRVAGLPLAA